MPTIAHPLTWLIFFLALLFAARSWGTTAEIPTAAVGGSGVAWCDDRVFPSADDERSIVPAIGGAQRTIAIVPDERGAAQEANATGGVDCEWDVACGDTARGGDGGGAVLRVTLMGGAVDPKSSISLRRASDAALAAHAPPTSDAAGGFALSSTREAADTEWIRLEAPNTVVFDPAMKIVVVVLQRFGGGDSNLGVSLALECHTGGAVAASATASTSMSRSVPREQQQPVAVVTSTRSATHTRRLRSPPAVELFPTVLSTSAFSAVDGRSRGIRAGANPQLRFSFVARPAEQGDERDVGALDLARAAAVFGYPPKPISDFILQRITIRSNVSSPASPLAQRHISDFRAAFAVVSVSPKELTLRVLPFFDGAYEVAARPRVRRETLLFAFHPELFMDVVPPAHEAALEIDMSSPRVPIHVVPADVGLAALVSSAVLGVAGSLASRNPATIAHAARMRGLLALEQCWPDLDGTISPFEHPLRFSFGSSDDMTRGHAGCVLGNAVFVLLFFTAHFFVTAVVHCAPCCAASSDGPSAEEGGSQRESVEGPFTEAAARCRFPSLVVIVLFSLCTDAVASGVLCIRHSTDTRVLIVAWMMTLLLWGAALPGVLFYVSVVWNGFAAEFDTAREAWCDSPFIRHFGFLFATYRGSARWFLCVEAMVSGALGVILGGIPIDGSSCSIPIIAYLTVIGAHAVILLAVRPHTSAAENAASIGFAALEGCAAGLLLIGAGEGVSGKIATVALFTVALKGTADLVVVAVAGVFAGQRTARGASLGEKWGTREEDDGALPLAATTSSRGGHLAAAGAPTIAARHPSSDDDDDDWIVQDPQSLLLVPHRLHRSVPHNNTDRDEQRVRDADRHRRQRKRGSISRSGSGRKPLHTHAPRTDPLGTFCSEHRARHHRHHHHHHHGRDREGPTARQPSPCGDSRPLSPLPPRCDSDDGGVPGSSSELHSSDDGAYGPHRVARAQGRRLSSSKVLLKIERRQQRERQREVAELLRRDPQLRCDFDQL